MLFHRRLALALPLATLALPPPSCVGWTAVSGPVTVIVDAATFEYSVRVRDEVDHPHLDRADGGGGGDGVNWLLSDGAVALQCGGDRFSSNAPPPPPPPPPPSPPSPPGPASAVGCADGSCEGFCSNPAVRGCGAQWSGAKSLRQPATGSPCGVGTGAAAAAVAADASSSCGAPADACGAGWAPCLSHESEALDTLRCGPNRLAHRGRVRSTRARHRWPGCASLAYCGRAPVSQSICIGTKFLPLLLRSFGCIRRCLAGKLS